LATTINGRISRPREVDRYRLPVEPGAYYRFELTAASLGTSQLDALLTVYDDKGKKLGARDDVDGADPVLTIKAPEGAREITIAIEDLLGRGGPAFGYRLAAEKDQPDFTLDLNTPFVNVPAGGTDSAVVIVRRRGYEGDLRLTIPNLPKGFHLAGGNIPADSAAQRFETPDPGFTTARSKAWISSRWNSPSSESRKHHWDESSGRLRGRAWSWRSPARGREHSPPRGSRCSFPWRPPGPCLWRCARRPRWCESLRVSSTSWTTG
jgi:hypothetical protein